MSNPMDVFVELANAQGAAYPNGTEPPWTAARPQDFAPLAMFMLGRDNKKFFTAGTEIKTQFDPKIHTSNFGPKRPAADHRRGSESGMDFMSTNWTEYEWNEEISWHEINLQGSGTFEGGSQKFWDIKAKKDKDFTLDPIKKMARELFATPTAAMFDTQGTGVAPIKSVFTGCNVWERRHYVSQPGQGGENLFPGMTDQQGLDPEHPRFKREDSYGLSYTNGGSQLAPTKVTYDSSGNADINTGEHLLEQLDYFLDLLKWKPIPMAGSYADANEVMPSSFMTTREGRRLFKRTCRAHGELFATLAPVGNPKQSDANYGGIPLMTSDHLRDAELYPDISGGVDSAAERAPVNERDANGIPGAYFYAFDPRCVNIWFHKMRQWSITDWETMTPRNKDIMFRIGRFIGNMHYESFVTNGILAPSVPVLDYA